MTPEFREQLRLRFAPLLREQGFRGSGTTFRRTEGEVIQVVHVGGSKWGGSCCVELALHLTFLPAFGGGPIDAKTIRGSDCEFQRRLAPSGAADHWWQYGADVSETTRSVDDIVATYLAVGAPHLDRYRTFPGPFADITPDSIRSGDLAVLPGRSWNVRAALAMARIAAHQQRLDLARQFAEVGLAHFREHPHGGAWMASQLEKFAS